jgi:hypothetical protein
MTTRQEKFARNLAKGMSQRQAYRDAYPNARKWKDESVDNKASALARSGEVSARLAELTRKAESKAVMSRQKRLEALSRIAKRNEKSSPKDAIAAIKALNDMTGDNAPVKQEHTLDILSLMAQKHRDMLEDE